MGTPPRKIEAVDRGGIGDCAGFSLGMNKTECNSILANHYFKRSELFAGGGRQLLSCSIELLSS